MKKNTAEAQLKKLCAPKGAITVFQRKIRELLNNKESDCFNLLLDMIILVTTFEDKHMKALTKIKEGLKTANPELFCKFGRFYATLKVCGRDMYKTPKHHSFVSNQAKIKKLKIVGRMIHYSPTKTTIYLASEFNRSPLSLAHLKDLKDKKNLGDFHDRMIADITFETKKFIKENSREICKPLFQKM